MNRDEIIAMAREAGFRTGQINLSNGPPVPFIAPASGTSCMFELERFAALVAAREREVCAQVCDAKAHEVRLWCNESNVIACATAIRARGRP